MFRGELGKFEGVPDDEIEAAIGSGDLLEVDATGCGCIMYRNQVFLDIERPWFELSKNEKTGAPVGEDIGFCVKLKENGYSIYVDCLVDIQHLSLVAVDWNTYKVWQKLRGAAGRAANLKP